MYQPNFANNPESARRFSRLPTIRVAVAGVGAVCTATNHPEQQKPKESVYNLSSTPQFEATPNVNPSYYASYASGGSGKTLDNAKELSDIRGRVARVFEPAPAEAPAQNDNIPEIFIGNNDELNYIEDRTP